jgi:phosphoribosylanthranilate isomerase
MTKIKICGLTKAADIEYVNELSPDYIGFVFAKSSRRIDIDTAKALSSRLSAQIKPVGVFVNADIPFITKLVFGKTIRLVQLHGDENESYISALKKLIEVPIIKAVRVKNPAEILKAQKLPCDFLLLDTYVENQIGGSGKAFDHSIIPALEKPFFLAGGLNPQNVKKAMEISSPYAVDVSSGVEESGIKSRRLMKEFIDIIREMR